MNAKRRESIDALSGSVAAVPIPAADLEPVNVHSILGFHLWAKAGEGLLDSRREQSVFLFMTKIFAA